ncbi:hypothetical protein QQS21_012766 [Conoideocrella luteorostrata]|uniref:Nucleoside phosphorylase domain-containing protein n=1 Tax=Conoideocrella luteorostrata TaxID=1105319 RepID=A0AAJ0CAJ6_9HYPO|nr:hypothetical protein QQS21_012766 [Conoideocrella luteorostrata]
MSSTSEPLSHSDYLVGWICALPKELVAATAMLDEEYASLPKPPNDHNAYTFGRVGNHNVVIACLAKGEIGNNNAATVATRMASTFPSIKFGLLVGIGGGVPKSVRLGDVVVSTPTSKFGGVVQWDFGKAEKAGAFQQTGALNRPPTALLTALTKLERDHDMKGSKIPEYLENLKAKWPRLVPKYIRTSSLRDVLFRADYGHVEKPTFGQTGTPDEAEEDEEDDEDDEDDEEEEADCCINCDPSKIVSRRARDMRVHYGLIASGNQVIKDATFRDEVNKRLGGKVLCFEMEAAGLMNDFPCIVIRGICDYADSHKNKAWQEHAAAVAAAFAKELLSVVEPGEVDHMPAMKGSVHAFAKIACPCSRDKRSIAFPTLNQISHNIDNLVRRQNDQDEQIILDWLTPIDFTLLQSDLISKRQKGTGEWFLRSLEFQNWINHTTQTLFCPGNPGTGKTVMSSIVVDHLYTKFGNDRDVAIAYVYCSYQPQQEQKPEDLLASLLKQFARRNPKVFANVKGLYERHVSNGSRPSLDEIIKMLQSAIKLFCRVFIIVDALDEFHSSNYTNWKKILVLKKPWFASGAHINLFVTSRSISEITAEFLGDVQKDIRAPESDVLSYVNDNIMQFRVADRFAERPDVQDKIRSGIVRAADGMFLLATLLVKSLKCLPTLGHVTAVLQNSRQGQSGLVDMYQMAMKRIKAQEKGCRELAMQVLAWVTHAKRAISTTEVRHAVAIRSHQSKLDESFLPGVEILDSLCAGLVTVDKNSDLIRLVHYTAQEYFEETNPFPEAHREITTTCLTYLSFDNFSTGFCVDDEEFSVRLQQNPLYDYAARNWGHHAREAAETSEQLILYLENEANVSASSQAMMAFSRRYSNYSQEIPKLKGLHLAAYFGLGESIIRLLENGNILDVEDSHKRTPLWYAVDNGYDTVVDLLLAIGANPDSEDVGERTLLSYSAERGHETITKLLLACGVDPNSKATSKFYSGRTSLSFAAGNGHEEVVKLLLAIDADPDLKDLTGRTALSFAAENGHHAVVKLLLSKVADPDSKDLVQRTPLSFAADGGHEAVVKLLLAESSVDPHSKDLYGRSTLSYAVWSGDEGVVNQLVEKGVLLNSVDRDGRTPLCLAAGGGQESIVRLMLAMPGIDPDSSDMGGRTPLSLAARYGHAEVARLLLEDGKVDVNHKDNEGCTPLALATENGHENVVRLLLDRGVELESRDKDSRTPLFCAAENGRDVLVRLLLGKGVESDPRDNDRRTPLLCAAENGHETVIKLLVQNEVDFEAVDKSTRTLLWWAAEKGYEALATQLLERGVAGLELKDSKFGQTPLSCAAEKGHAGVVKFLVANGADPHTKDKDGRTPLSWAVENKFKDVIRILLALNTVNVNSMDIYGRTSLSYAAWTGDAISVQLLLENGARPELKDKKGWSPLFWAAKNEHEAVFKLLLENGADIESRDSHDRTPLSYGAENGQETMVKLLLKSGADIESRDSQYHMTPLLLAIGRGHEAVVKLLLENGADIEAKQKSNESTPLSWATFHRDAAIIKLLLDRGANVNARSLNGRTPLSSAAQYGHKAIVEALLEKGADPESRDKENMTPLSLAAKAGHAAVYMLLEKAANTGGGDR